MLDFVGDNDFGIIMIRELKSLERILIEDMAGALATCTKHALVLSPPSSKVGFSGAGAHNWGENIDVICNIFRTKGIQFI